MWDAVKWTLAGQVAAFFSPSKDAEAVLVEDAPPADAFAALRAAGAVDDALAFLSFALPRRAAIAWAHECIGATSGLKPLLPRDVIAFSAAGAWLADPTDEQRWVAQDAARAAGFETPEALLAFAVFVSGGSLSLPGSPQPVPAAADLAGKMVNGALLLATVRAPAPRIRQVKSAFLDRGACYAEGTAQATKRLEHFSWPHDGRAHAPDAQNRKPEFPRQRPAPYPGP